MGRPGNGLGHQLSLHSGLRAELRGRNLLHGGVQQGGHDWLPPEGDGYLLGFRLGDLGDVGAAVEDGAGDLRAGELQGGRWLGGQREELGEEVTDVLSLGQVQSLSAGHGLHAVDGAGVGLGVGVEAAVEAGGSEGHGDRLLGPQGIVEHLLVAGLSGDCPQVGVDHRRVVHRSGLEVTDSQQLHAGD